MPTLTRTTIAVILTSVIVALLAACGGSGGGDNGSAPPTTSSTPDARATELINAGTVLWIGAHPDDETVAAPILADICRPGGATCYMLVLTRGEAGVCHLAGGCQPDVGTVRANEMQASAQLFDATLTLWDLPDAGGSVDNVLANWSQHEGSQALLIQRVVNALEAVRPGAILTFDPRNGVTCHPAHRIAAALAIEATKHVTFSPPTVHLVASRMEASFNDATPGTIGFVPYAPQDPLVYRYDARRALVSRTGSAWDWLIKTLQAHPSQQPPEVVAAFSNAPAEQQKMFLLRDYEAVPGDTPYQCPP